MIDTYRSRLSVVAVVVVGLLVMVCSAIASITSASSCVGSGASEDRSKNEALGHGKSAQANPYSDGTKEECLHCGSEDCDQHNTRKQGMLHLRLFLV